MAIVWIGLAGSLLVAFAACGTYWSYAPDGWALPVANAVGNALPPEISRVLMVIGVGLLCAGWWSIRPRGETATPPAAARGRALSPVQRSWVTLAVWSLPLLLVPPVLTADPFAYADSGWLFLNGRNQYEVGYGAIGGPFARAVDPLWFGAGVAYPPLQFVLNAAAVLIGGTHPYWSVIAMRLWAVIGVVLVAALVPRIAAPLGVDAAKASWLAFLNPLLVVHFVGGAHNDAIMVGVSLLAIWVTLRARGTRHAWVWQFLVAPVLVGVAMLLKQQAGLTVIAVAGLPVAAALAGLPVWRRLRLWAWRLAVVTAVAVGVFVGGSLATGLGFGWIKWIDQMGRTGTAAPFNLIGQVLDGWFPDLGAYRIVGVISTIAMFAALAYCFWRFMGEPMRWLGWGALWFTVLGSALHPWYVVWPIALLALTPLTRRGWVGLVALSLTFALWNALQTVLFPSAPL